MMFTLNIHGNDNKEVYRGMHQPYMVDHEGTNRTWRQSPNERDSERESNSKSKTNNNNSAFALRRIGHDDGRPCIFLLYASFLGDVNFWKWCFNSRRRSSSSSSSPSNSVFAKKQQQEFQRRLGRLCPSSRQGHAARSQRYTYGSISNIIQTFTRRMQSTAWSSTCHLFWTRKLQRS